MKTRKQFVIASVLMICSFLTGIEAQAQAYSSGGGSETGHKSTLGYQNTASGNYSLAAGSYNIATGQSSISLGLNNIADGLSSVAIGMYTHSREYHGITIGHGYNGKKPLINNTDGIMFGAGSNLPTLFISAKNSENRTGKVGIGNVTNPQAKLHIKGDASEDADIFLASTGSKKSAIRFRTDDNNITVKSDNVLQINATKTYLMLNAPKVCFGSATTFLSNTNNEVFSIKAPNTIAQEAEDINLSARRNVTLTGKVGINTANTTDGFALAVDGGMSSTGRFEVKSEETIQITAKEGIHYKPIMLRGNVGINTESVANGYALSVNGGIITTKVFIQDVGNWPDYVFDDTYKLLPLHELKKFIADNKHLPEVPSESEVISHGYDVNEMQSIMLKKIEELTLYTLQQQEEIETLKRMIDELKGK